MDIAQTSEYLPCGDAQKSENLPSNMELKPPHLVSGVRNRTISKPTSSTSPLAGGILSRAGGGGAGGVRGGEREVVGGTGRRREEEEVGERGGGMDGWTVGCMGGWLLVVV